MSSPLDTAETGVTHAQRVGRQAVVMETEIAVALVAVARAAEKVVAAYDADVAWEELEVEALREALSRLGKDTAA